VILWVSLQRDLSLTASEDADLGAITHARSKQTKLWFYCLAGFGASKRSPKGRLGSVSDYCSRPRTPSPHAPLSPPRKIHVQMDPKAAEESSV
jgi:hypothetical protein